MDVMLIDDDAAVLRALGDAMRMNGFRPHSFDSPKEAVAAYAPDKIDAVVTDYKMPAMNGVEVLRAIYAKNPDAYIIILTGYADVDNAIAAVNSGAYAFFQKPIQIAVLVDTLRQIQSRVQKQNKKSSKDKLLREAFNRLTEAYKAIQVVLQDHGEPPPITPHENIEVRHSKPAAPGA